MAIEEKKSVKKHTDIMPELKGKCVCFLHDETDANPAMKSQINSLVREAVNTLVDASITWICENKSKYLCRGVKELSALSDVVKAHKNLLIMDNTRKKEILDNFFASFVNNLWFYENGLYKKENTITTRYVGCYFVGYRHYNGETYHFPLAALKCVLKDEEKIDFVIEAFSKKCADEFSKYCDEALLKLDKNSGASVAEKSTSNKITFFLWTVFSVFLFISGATLLIGKIKSPLWSMFSEVSGKTANVLQTIGFISENSYNINHNSSLIVLVLLASAFGLIIGVISAAILVKRMVLRTKVKYRNYILKSEADAEKYLNSLSQKYKAPAEIISQLKRIDITESRIIREKNINLDSYMRLSEMPLPKAVSKKKAPGLKRQVILLLLFLLVVSFVKLSGDAEFVKAYDDTVSEVVYAFDGIIKKTVSAGATTYGLEVYAKPDSESFVLINIPVYGEYFLIDEKNPTEGYTKIKYKSDYGYVKGWILDAAKERYSPYNVKNMKYIEPAQLIPSGKDNQEPFTSDKVYDGLFDTAWKLTDSDYSTGTGKSLRIYFNEEDAASIKVEKVCVLGIATGYGKSDTKFLANARPLSFDVEFMNSGQVQETIAIELEDTADMQYIRFSNPAVADSVRLIVTDVEPGEETTDSYISEVILFSEAMEEQL